MINIANDHDFSKTQDNDTLTFNSSGDIVANHTYIPPVKNATNDTKVVTNNTNSTVANNAYVPITNFTWDVLTNVTIRDIANSRDNNSITMNNTGNIIANHTDASALA